MSRSNRHSNNLESIRNNAMTCQNVIINFTQIEEEISRNQGYADDNKAGENIRII